jgi:hypothetical protein
MRSPTRPRRCSTAVADVGSGVRRGVGTGVAIGARAQALPVHGAGALVGQKNGGQFPFRQWQLSPQPATRSSPGLRRGAERAEPPNEGPERREIAQKVASP